MINQKGFSSIIVVSIVLVIGVALIGIYFRNIPKTNPQQTNQQTSPNQTSNPATVQYQISGSQVIQLANGQKSVLFNNVSDVSEIRLGPDGRTLHFKPIKIDPNKYHELCEPIKYPRSAPPWDFRTMQTHSCNTGYLKNSDYFVYLKVDSSSQAQLFYENLKTGEVKQVSVSRDIINSPNINLQNDGGVVGDDGLNYGYPQQDLYFKNNSLVLAFDKLILAIDIQKNSLIGSYIQQGVYGNLNLLNQNSLPYVVVEDQLEGPAKLHVLIDMSDGNFKTVNLPALDKRSYFTDFNVKPIVWESNDVLFNFTDFENATKKLPSSYDQQNLPANDKAKMAELDKQAEQYLKSNYGYLDAKCILEPAQVSGCDGLKQINHYKYTSDKGLVKL